MNRQLVRVERYVESNARFAFLQFKLPFRSTLSQLASSGVFSPRFVCLLLTKCWHSSYEVREEGDLHAFT